MAHVFQMKTKPHGFQRYDEFIRDQVIGIGWPLIGNLDGISKDELRERLRNVYHSLFGGEAWQRSWRDLDVCPYDGTRGYRVGSPWRMAQHRNHRSLSLCETSRP